MTLKEAIDIGRACCANTIGQVADLMFKLYTNIHVNVFSSDEEWEKWCDEYEAWRAAYEETFSLPFEDCKI